MKIAAISVVTLVTHQIATKVFEVNPVASAVGITSIFGSTAAWKLKDRVSPEKAIILCFFGVMILVHTGLFFVPRQAPVVHSRFGFQV